MQEACFLIMLRGEHTLVFHIGISLVLLAKVDVLKFLILEEDYTSKQFCIFLRLFRRSGTLF